MNEAEQQTIVAEMKAGRARMKQIFESTISESDDFHSGNFDQKSFRVALSRIAVQSQNVVGDAYTLLTMLRTQGRNLILTRDLLVYSLIAFFGLCFFTVSVFIFRRIFNSIAEIQAGTVVIGTGNLDFFLKEIRNDEFGQLAHAFNQMVSRLKAVTSSKEDLEKEVKERKQAEKLAEKLQEANSQQDAFAYSIS